MKTMNCIVGFCASFLISIAQGMEEPSTWTNKEQEYECSWDSQEGVLTVWRCGKKELTVEYPNNGLLSKNIAHGKLRMPTFNQMGYTVLDFNNVYIRRFLHACASVKPVAAAEVGCAHGIVARHVLQRAHPLLNYYANDACSDHLDLLKNSVPPAKASQLVTVRGEYPATVAFDRESLSILGMMHVAHFFTGTQLELAFKQAHFELKPGGALIMTAFSIYCGYVQKSRRARVLLNAVKEYPGYLKRRVTIGKKGKGVYPEWIHFLSKEIVEQRARNVGFEIERCDYYRPEGEDDQFYYNGQECVGLIAIKKDEDYCSPDDYDF